MHFPRLIDAFDVYFFLLRSKKKINGKDESKMAVWLIEQVKYSKWKIRQMKKLQTDAEVCVFPNSPWFNTKNERSTGLWSTLIVSKIHSIFEFL